MASTRGTMQARGSGLSSRGSGRGRGTSPRIPVGISQPKMELNPDYKQAGVELEKKIQREGFFTFVKEDLQLKTDAPSIPYFRRTMDEKTVGSWGQLKLFLGILEFICLYHKKSLVPRPLVLYIGAAPGLSFPLLSQMFPDFDWDLWDGADFGFDSTEKITLHKSFFFDKDALQYKEQGDRILFLSDIRTIDSRSGDRNTVEAAIWSDMQMQQEWVKIINPFAANLKFRLPYGYTFTSSTVNYLSGQVLLQGYVGPTSTETRLVPDRIDGKYEEVNWDTRKYEEQMMYHNSVIREKAQYYVPIAKYTVMPDTDDIINNYDGCYMIYVFDLYLDYIGYPENNNLPNTPEDSAYREERFKSALALSLWVRDYILEHRTIGKSFREIKVYTRKFMKGESIQNFDLEDLDDGDLDDSKFRTTSKPAGPSMNISTSSIFAGPNLSSVSISSGSFEAPSFESISDFAIPPPVTSPSTLPPGFQQPGSPVTSSSTLPPGFQQPGSPVTSPKQGYTLDLSSMSDLLSDLNL